MQSPSTNLEVQVVKSHFCVEQVCFVLDLMAGSDLRVKITQTACS